MQNANKVMRKMITDNGSNKKKKSILDKHILMMAHRIEMLKKRNLFKVVPLLMYFPYYQEIKSFLVEIYMVIKRSEL